MASRTKIKVAPKKKKTTTTATATATKKKKPKPDAFLRLERGEGDARVFWEITQTDAVIVVRAGRYLYAGRTSERAYKDKATADAVFADAVAEKRADGYSEPTPKEVIGGSSRKGVVERNPELESLIEEDPSDLSRYLIYADWLQQKGDPRGELIMAQHKIAMVPLGEEHDAELDPLEHVEWRLFREFGRELLGPLTKYTLTGSGVNTSVRAFAWRCGFIRAASLHSIEALNVVLGHPAGRFIERLILNSSIAQEGCSILRTRSPKTLTTLCIQTDYRGAELEPLMPLPGSVRTLWFTGRVLSVGAIASFDGLEELYIGETTPAVITELSRARWPSLKRLHLMLTQFDDPNVKAMTNLVAGLLRQMPALECTSLRRWWGMAWNAEAWDQSSLAEAVFTALRDVENKVTELKLEMVISAGASELLPLVRSLSPKIRLQLPVQAIAKAVVRAEYLSLVKGLTFLPQDPLEEYAREDVTPLHHERFA